MIYFKTTCFILFIATLAGLAGIGVNMLACLVLLLFGTIIFLRDVF